MALIKCKECGNEVSTKAAACPKCGALGSKRTSPVTMVIAILFAIALLPLIFGSGTSEYRAPAVSPAPVTQSAAPATHLEIYSKFVPSLTINGKRVSRGITHDQFLAGFKFKRVGQQTWPDPQRPGGLVLIAWYSEAGQPFLLEWRRERDAGPYVLASISVPPT